MMIAHEAAVPSVTTDHAYRFDGPRGGIVVTSHVALEPFHARFLAQWPMTPEPPALVNEEQILLAAVGEVTKRIPPGWTAEVRYEGTRGQLRGDAVVSHEWRQLTLWAGAAHRYSAAVRVSEQPRCNRFARL